VTGTGVPTDDLTAIAAHLWVRLARAPKDRHSPWHTPVVGTSDGDMRVMVLRHTDPATGALRFHTDARSPKAALIGTGAPVSLLLYDAAAKLQLRCAGTGRIDTDGAAVDAAWAASAPASRRCYLARSAPSSASDTPTSGLPAEVEGRVPSMAESEPGRAHFAMLTVTLARIDWLYLAHDGHRRALFTRRADQWDAGWLVP
jgi:pyridoxamine 5'-phosphate oxidase